MSLVCFVLVVSEFMPISLLTPVAYEPHITKGQAGQAIALLQGGTALAFVIAAPMGSFLGSVIGWRGRSSQLCR